MSVDGFLPEHRDAFMAYSPDTMRRMWTALGVLSRVLHVEYVGMDRIPTGRALIVANHAFGWDVALPMAAIWNRQGRHVWALGEHAWWKVPFVRRLAAAVGTVDGTRRNVGRLLEADELVLVLPGGLREAVKPRELRYRLLWGHRYGFVRAAILHRTPIVPLASIGADDLFDFVGNAYRRGERLLRRSGIPLPLPLPIPHRVHLKYVFGEPILPGVPPEQADDYVSQRRFRREVEGALHEIIETELARRVGIDLT